MLEERNGGSGYREKINVHGRVKRLREPGTHGTSRFRGAQHPGPDTYGSGCSLDLFSLGQHGGELRVTVGAAWVERSGMKGWIRFCSQTTLQTKQLQAAKVCIGWAA